VAIVSYRIGMVGGSKRTVAKIEMGVLGYYFPWGSLYLNLRTGYVAGLSGVDLPQDACYTTLVE
jgi:hypothetical protein